MAILVQKRHPYTGILGLEMPGDSENTFLRCGDVLVLLRCDCLLLLFHYCLVLLLDHCLLDVRLCRGPCSDVKYQIKISNVIDQQPLEMPSYNFAVLCKRNTKKVKQKSEHPPRMLFCPSLSGLSALRTVSHRQKTVTGPYVTVPGPYVTVTGP